MTQAVACDAKMRWSDVGWVAISWEMIVKHRGLSRRKVAEGSLEMQDRAVTEPVTVAKLAQSVSAGTMSTHLRGDSRQNQDKSDFG